MAERKDDDSRRSSPKPRLCAPHPDEEDVVKEIIRENESDALRLQSFRSHAADAGAAVTAPEPKLTDCHSALQELGFLPFVYHEVASLRVLKNECPFIVYSYGLTIEPGPEMHTYLVLEYYGGGTLHDKVRRWNDNARNFYQRRHRRFPAELRPAPESTVEVVHAVGCCVRALVYAHYKGVLHCDIKADNIFCREDNGMYVLGDWGLGYTDDWRAPKNVNVYAQFYRPPEVWLQYSQFDDKADIFALGAQLLSTFTRYQCCTAPFQAVQAIVDMFPRSMDRDDAAWLLELPLAHEALINAVEWPWAEHRRSKLLRRDCMAHPILKGKSLLEDLMKDMCHPNPRKRLRAEEIIAKYPFLGTTRKNVASALMAAEKRDERRCMHFNPDDAWMSAYYCDVPMMERYRVHVMEKPEEALDCV